MENSTDLSTQLSPLLDEVEEYRQKNVKLFYRLLLLSGVCTVLYSLFYVSQVLEGCNLLSNIIFPAGTVILTLTFAAEYLFYKNVSPDARKKWWYITAAIKATILITALLLIYSAFRLNLFPDNMKRGATILLLLAFGIPFIAALVSWYLKKGKITTLLWFALLAGSGIALLLFLVAAYGYYLTASGCSSELKPLFWVVAGYIFLFVAPYLFTNSLYRKRYKEQILPVIANKLGYHYTPKGEVAWPLLKKPEMLFGTFDKSEHEDGFTGTFEGKDIAFEEVRISWRGAKGRVTIFSGLLIAMQLEKNVDVPIAVLRNNATLHGEWKSEVRNEMEQIFLEDPEFEEFFDVYSTDQVKSRSILTPRFMESLKNISTFYEGESISAYLHDKMIFITVNMENDMFEPSSFLLKSGPGKSVEKILSQIELQKSVMESLG